MRRQRRLYEIYTACFFVFMIPCNCKHVSFFVKSLKLAIKFYIKAED